MKTIRIRILRMMFSSSFTLSFLFCVITLSGGEQEGTCCVDNDVIRDFLLVHPPSDQTGDRSLVHETLFIKGSGEFVNPKEVIDRNHLYSICAHYDNSAKKCVNVFDELIIHLPGPGSYEVKASFCSEVEGCLCHVSTRVECCAASMKEKEVEALAQTFQKVGEMNIQLGVKLREMSRLNTPENEFKIPFPPWSCNQRRNIEFVIGIKSASTHAMLRNVMRQGWMRTYGDLWEAHQICAMFVIGRTQHTVEMSSYLQSERVYYQDTVLGDEIDVEDSYFNLHIKSLRFMEWFLRSDLRNDDKRIHPHLRHLVMVDDDVYVRLSNLIRMLYQAPASRHYRGEVFAEKFNHQYKPIRDPDHRNFVSYGDYPHDHFVPYASGNLYMLSVDLVEHLVERMHSLKTVGTLEDVSIAVWLSYISVSPVHEKGAVPFDEILDTASAQIVDSPNPISALSPLCDQVISINSVKDDTLSHFTEQYFSLCQPISLEFKCDSSSSRYPLRLRSRKTKYRPIVVYITEPSCWSSEVVKSLLESSYPSRSFEYYRIEIYASASGPRYKLPPSVINREVVKPPDILVISSIDESPHTDGLCHIQPSPPRSASNVPARNHLLHWRDDCKGFIKESIREIGARNVFLVNGEAVNMSPMLENVSGSPSNLVILNAYSDDKFTSKDLVSATNFQSSGAAMVHVSNSATSFANMPSYDPLQHKLIFPKDSQSIHAKSLLAVRTEEWAKRQLVGKTRSVAYLYFRCDRPHREEFFNHVRDLVTDVDALGACSGTGQYHAATQDDLSTFITQRFSSDFAVRAVDSYKPYKFVIAFENAAIDGYITEKMTNAFLANAVPIYFGAPDVHTYFNRDSFINCNDFKSLYDCALFVKTVDENDDLFSLFLQQQPIHLSEWCQFFQWQHHEVPECEGVLYHNMRNISSVISETFVL